jgi:sulfonate transport system permease protein
VGGAVLPVVILAGWSAITAAEVVPAHQLPSPQAVVLAAIDLAGRGILLHDLSISVQRVVTGFALGSSAGLLLGGLVVRSRRARILLSPSMTALRSVPSMAWLPLLVLSLGIGERPKIVLIAIGAALPLFATLITRARAAESDTTPPVQAASIVSGLRLGLTQSWVLLVAAELLHSSGGLGFLLADSSSAGRIDRLFIAMLLLATLARVTDSLLGVVERRLARRSD